MFHSRRNKPVLGLIGGIGSGKSLVAGELAKHGGYLIAGDHLGHEALKEPETRCKVVKRFGQDIVDADGNIDRRKLGPLVFASRENLGALEDLVFPFIEERIEKEIARARHNDDVRFIVLDAAIMLEAGWGRVCEKLIFVDAPRSMRLERLARKHGWTEQEVSARETMQMDLSQKKARADFVIDNGQGPGAIPDQVRDLLRRLDLIAESV